MRLLIATQNQGKYREITEVLSRLPIEICSLADLKLTDEVEETGQTHEANAILKARYFFQKTGMPTLGEDSGIYVDAFPGELGVSTRRWRGLEATSDEEWIRHFLGAMEAMPSENRTAKFFCYAALILTPEDAQNPQIFFGETPGVITQKLEAPLKSGIPISSCFRPEGFEKVYAALSLEEKNRVSHRGKAMHEVLAYLQKMWRL